MRTIGELKHWIEKNNISDEATIDAVKIGSMFILQVKREDDKVIQFILTNKSI